MTFTIHNTGRRMFLNRPAAAIFAFAMALSACGIEPEHRPAEEEGVGAVEREVSPAPLFYHIFVRSFYDSNGDRQGDLRGITQKLDYLESLGVTGILLTPLYPSQFYHNYFADDFYGVDAEFGDMAAFAELVAEIHERNMVIYLDQEIQYVSGQHDWFRSSFKNPQSEFDNFILYADDANNEPVATLFGKMEFDVWPMQKQHIYTVNMLEPDVRDYFADYLSFWLDPNGDGDFSDGVDGFRIDHMMDDLDNAGALTNLFSEFWRPIFDLLREKKPDIDIIAEQYDWGYGEDFLTAGDADKVFGFPIWRSIGALDAGGLSEAIVNTNAVMTAGKGQFVFIENHDTDRFAHAFADQPAILKLGAAANLLIGWTPIVYYGQEIGMTGAKIEGEEARMLEASGDDARDIPVRQAFRWNPAPNAPGHATWYRDPVEAYPIDDSNQPGDGRSVEEQRARVDSLLQYYRKLSNLRSTYPALGVGETRVILQFEDQLLIERRVTEGPSVVVAFNFSELAAEITVPTGLTLGERILGGASSTLQSEKMTIAAHSASAWLLEE